MRPTIDASPLVHALPRIPPVSIESPTTSNALGASAAPVAPPASEVTAIEGTGAAAGSPSVLFVDQSGELGGAEFALLQLAGHCAAHSEVVLLSDGPFRTRLEALGARVQVISDARVSGIARQASGLDCLRVIPGMFRQVRAIAARARHFDVLFLNTQKALVLGVLGKSGKQPKQFGWIHQMACPSENVLFVAELLNWRVQKLVLHA